MSFKLGTGERAAEGRCFTDHTDQTLGAALANVGVELVDVWVSGDLRASRANEQWLNAIALRPEGDVKTR